MTYGLATRPTLCCLDMLTAKTAYSGVQLLRMKSYRDHFTQSAQRGYPCRNMTSMDHSGEDENEQPLTVIKSATSRSRSSNGLLWAVETVGEVLTCSGEIASGSSRTGLLLL